LPSEFCFPQLGQIKRKPPMSARRGAVLQFN
jgi:hypothetical protein